MPSISASVGKGGVNQPDDVRVVQRLLNRHDLTPLRLLTVDGISGPATEGAIRHFQEVKVGMKYPDSRVDPGGKTIRRLRDVGSDRSTSTEVKTSTRSLSGAKWWRANQGRYPNSRRLEDLEGDFREKATRFVAALGDAGATVSIASTRRNKIRAHLMHYSWKVSRGRTDPSEVPQISGLDIQWDHGDLAKSQAAAGEMVRLFNMAYIASLTSNHIAGKAIDMNISWTGDLGVDVPGRGTVQITDGPRNGASNTALHDLGQQFGVLKLRTDPPHWSHNGR